MYFDPIKQKYKSGGQGKDREGNPQAGTLRRLIDVLNQLDLTFDLYAFHELGAAPLLELLPREFKGWRSPKRLPLDG